MIVHRVNEETRRTPVTQFRKFLFMLENASNQELLHAWKDGNQQAAQVLVKRYMVRLTALARSRLSRKLARRLDPEDIVLSAWRSFFVAVDADRLSAPNDDNLWPLLVTLTIRKLAKQSEHHTAIRRDAEREIAFDDSSSWQDAVARGPSPEEAAMLVDEIESVMRCLSETDRMVLEKRLQGDDQVAIARELGCSERTVRRAMERIRSHLKDRETADVSTPLLPFAVSPKPSNYEPELDNLVPTIRYDDVQLLQMVGLGGFGRVYRARFSDHTVAVKFLKKQFWSDSRAVQCLLHETQRIQQLSHPNIIRHFGWGTTQHGAVFSVMEWINGVHAEEWKLEDNPTISEVVRCGLEIAEALEAAHRVGIIHGDVSPRNVLRRKDGTFILTDFGLAQGRTIDTPSFLGGTPGFLAPEQVSDVFGTIGEQTDTYGLAGVMYFLLTGVPPIPGDDAPTILANVISMQSPLSISLSRPDISVEITGMIETCLSKETSARSYSLPQVRDILARTLGHAGS